MSYKVDLGDILGEMPDRQLESLRQQIVEEQRFRKDIQRSLAADRRLKAQTASVEDEV